MKLVTFQPMRTIGLPNVSYIKPEHLFKEKQTIAEADWILFPEYWQVNVLVYGLKKRIFPSIQSYHLGHNKVEMTRALWAVCPEHVPYTQILANTEANIEHILEEFPFPFIAKEVRNSMGRGVFLIESEAQLQDYARHNDILYVQEYLPIDRDLRITFVGDEVIGAYWRVGQEGHFLNNVAQGGTISFEHVPPGAIRLVETVAKQLGINHAGFDIAVVGERLYFLEFNVLFGNMGFRDNQQLIERKIWEYLLTHSSPDSPPFKPITPAPRAS
ncbi:ribosomal protein S6--L-glutamate ligase [Caldalkalibacillus uzonensis]|uniref:Ribosomal protein S6--L-glutamate ligase n=1 Tax=Caldalkalibacillus uzonensis TaxID=353224 RepID=A0ABU0CUH4_9BACI|nr:ribosomal protein S6--L-glutamate ligase [Caldalkalibacillus uzonensis]